MSADSAPLVVQPRVSRTLTLAIGMLVVVLFSAVAAPWLAPYDPSAQLDLIALKNAPPSLAHAFGTDSYSRDVLSRALFGARTSLHEIGRAHV